MKRLVSPRKRRFPIFSGAPLRYYQRVPLKKSHKKFTAAKEARRRARLAAGPPPSEKIIPDKRLKPPKHKKPLTDE